MAKRVNSFASDFEGMNKSADEKVIAMLKQTERTADAEMKPTQRAKPEKPQNPEVNHKVEGSGSHEVTSKKKKVSKPKPEMEWGKPVAYFNTRIPEKMAERLDDLVYKLKKKGEHKTKQDLAQEALQDLLRKHRCVKDVAID